MTDPLPDILIGFVAFLIIAAILSTLINYRNSSTDN